MPSDQERFWAKVDITDSCWEWTSSLRGGYGLFTVAGHNIGAHRWLWQFLNGAVPDGLELDHLCRNRKCVRPEHLEPVTHRENWYRGISPSAINARKTQCKNGHEFTPENTYTSPSKPGTRECIACLRSRDAAKPRKSDRGGWAQRTHCPRGHEYTEENTYRQPSKPNGRRCRECHRIAARNDRAVAK